MHIRVICKKINKMIGFLFLGWIESKISQKPQRPDLINMTYIETNVVEISFTFRKNSFSILNIEEESRKILGQFAKFKNRISFFVLDIK